MSLLNLATVFGPSLLRPPVADLGHDFGSNISQEVVVQVCWMNQKCKEKCKTNAALEI